jgi:thioredoxin-like negative regulator of GroEL
MRKTVAALLSAALLMFAGFAGAGGASAPLSTPELKQTIGANGKATLIFFQNPDGGPCKMQKEVLDKLQSVRQGNFNLVAINSMKQEDQKAFYDYGIRSLPSLVLVDKNRRIARVFPPGIQSKEVLTASLDKLK